MRIPSPLAVLALILFAGLRSAGEGMPSFQPEDLAFFEKEIRPVLADNCYECHSGTKAKSGLQLDHRAGWLRGTDYQKIVNSENPLESLVLHSVKHLAKAEAMPKEAEKLRPEAIAALEKWLALDLPWPPDAVENSRKDPRQHWSFQPRVPPVLPEGSGHPIDYFLNLKLKEKGITAAPQADRSTLYRRLSLDLLGLPPKFEELQAFVDDPAPGDGAWSALIDRFLASPHYGERWARHWMDVARYADTKGYEVAGRERDFIYSHTYRDWLIRAFNQDLPFDQFILYQLAAEKLVEWSGSDRHHLAALGFITLSKNGQQELIVDDRLDTTFQGLMGLTVSCARCHDHKFDPVSTAEYYSLFGIFRNSLDQVEPPIADDPDTPEFKAYREELAQLKKKREDFLAPKFAEILKAHPKIDPKNEGALIAKLSPEDRKEQGKLKDDAERFVASKKMEADRALVVTERSQPLTQNVYIRGNPSRPGPVVKPRFLQLASLEEKPEFTPGRSRLDLAREIASPNNPLTARVIVNRVWMWHFGEGLVRSVSDFGNQGEAPSHPELLDWLAQWLVDNGWSIKKLHHLLLTSQAWRQSTIHPDAEKWMLIDPENRLLWKRDPRRLEFEQMRDAMLSVSNELDGTLFGRSVRILSEPENRRRTLYSYIDRQNLPAVFRYFDFSNPQETTGQRAETTIPMQALFTMNSDFVTFRAMELAKKHRDSPDPVGSLHRAIFACDPTEQDRLLAASFTGAFSTELEPGRQNLTGWSYGWGSLDAASGKLDFKPFPHWSAKQREWRIKEEYPIKNSPLSYLRIGPNLQHPGATLNECCVLRWHSPRKMNISIQGELIRPAVNQGGTGLNAHLVSSRQGILLKKQLLKSQKSIPVSLENIEVFPDEIIYFVVDCDGDTSHDSYQWDPVVSNAGNAGERWKMSVDFAGPQKPLDAWSAYAQALLNTNRFLFVQ